jgi:NADPH:quinone reductase-like Zn-dependent oxidoreductase
MKAIRVSRSSPEGLSYSSANPAPTETIKLEDGIETPHPGPGQYVVKIKASTVIRDSLTWEELYHDNPSHMGNDFSGIIFECHSLEQDLKVGDEVYGMTSAHRGGTWAEYAMVTSEEVSLKPTHLSWEEAAALPLSALTADQALFEKAGLSLSASGKKRVLVTGASGAVGMYIVRFAAIAGYQTVAVSSSNARNEAFLQSLGASEIVEYDALSNIEPVDVVIDTVGGPNLAACWRTIKQNGVIISVDSSSYTFAEEHAVQGLTKGKESVRTEFFVVEPSRRSMDRVSNFVSANGIKGSVVRVLPLSRAQEAYKLASSREIGRGKVVLTVEE